VILQLLVRTRPNCIRLSPAGAISACRCYQVDFTTKHSKVSRRVLVSTGFVRYAYKSDWFVVHLDAICCKLKNRAQRGALWKVVDFSDQGQAPFPPGVLEGFSLSIYFNYKIQVLEEFAHTLLRTTSTSLFLQAKSFTGCADKVGRPLIQRKISSSFEHRYATKNGTDHFRK
jgi:hypothetical protein